MTDPNELTSDQMQYLADQARKRQEEKHIRVKYIKSGLLSSYALNRFPEAITMSKGCDGSRLFESLTPILFAMEVDGQTQLVISEYKLFLN